MEMEAVGPEEVELSAASPSPLEAENARLRLEVSELRERMQFYEEYWEKHSGDRAASLVGPDAEARLATIGAEAETVAGLRSRIACDVPSSEAALALGPNVSLEYTRDSPMFRRSALAFEQSLDGLGSMLEELGQRVRAWTSKAREADACGRKVSEWLRDRRHARALFSGAHASLGSLTVKSGAFADALDGTLDLRGGLCDRLDEQVADALDGAGRGFFRRRPTSKALPSRSLSARFG